jgi:hypothetical protein
MPEAMPAMKRSANSATAEVNTSISTAVMPTISRLTTICGLRECESAHQPAGGSAMSRPMAQPATMMPSVVASMPWDCTNSGSTGITAPKPSMTISVATRSGSNGPQCRSHAEMRARPIARMSGIVSHASRASADGPGPGVAQSGAHQQVVEPT